LEILVIWDRINLEMFEPSERHRDRQNGRDGDWTRAVDLTHPIR